MTLSELMWKKHKAMVLGLSGAGVVPGSILHVDYKPVDTLDSIFKIISLGFYSGELPTPVRHEANIWEIHEAKINKNDYDSELVDANLLRFTVKENISLDGSVSLPQYGFEISGKLEEQQDITLHVGQVTSRALKNKSMGFRGINALHSIEHINEYVWEKLNNDYLVYDVFYTNEIKLTFHSSGETSAKAKFEAGKYNISAGFEGTWKNDNVLSISGAPTVPFAVRGDEI